MAARQHPDLAEMGFEVDEEGGLKVDDIEIPPPPAPPVNSAVLGTRLMITHVKVKNFKSYAGEQIIGPLDKSFTAVVGPNGSGKSNVIDSLMFVFGHRADKIRAKKICSLIHKSSKHPNIESSTVTVYFSFVREEDGLKVKGSEFNVSRTVFLDNKSFYEINNRRVQQKEVVLKLRKYGIDMDYNRFLILQGEIESIAMMKPVQDKDTDTTTTMTQYIEDIIGSKRFEPAVKHFTNKIKLIDDAIKEKVRNLHIVDKELEKLEAPKNAALEYLRLDNKRILTENSIYHCRRKDAEDNLKVVTEKKTKHVTEMKALKSQLEKLQSSRKAIESQLAQVHKEYETVLKQCEDRKEEFKKLEQEDVVNLTNIKHAKGKIHTLKKTLEDSQNEMSKLTKQIGILESETAELQVKRKKLEEEKEIDEKKANEALGSLKEETEILQENKEQLETKLINLKKNSYEIKSEIDLIQSELDIHMSGEKKEKEKLSALISSLDKNKQSSEKEEKLLVSEEKEIGQLQTELQALKEQLAYSHEQQLTLTQQLRDERLKFDEANNTQQTSQSSSSLLKGLLKEKTEGRLPGVYGRLGDLGGIDEKYDVAISTACGRLDNIVTDNIGTAQNCIQFLKKHNLGYSTFIALDQMKKYECYVHQKRTYPENVPRLLDLVRVKDKSLLPAFYFALGDTLVARDLEQATRIGLQGRERHRVVTLKGEVIDMAGTMSGGGGRPMKGRMGQNVVECSFSKEDFDRMSASINALTRKLAEVKQKHSILDEEISQKSLKLSALQLSVKKRRLHCKAYKEQVEMLSSQIDPQKQKVAETSVDKKKIKSLEVQISEKTKVYTVAAKATSEMEEKVSKLQGEILKITKGKLGKAKKTVDQLKKKLDDIVQAISKSTVNVKQSKTKIKKLEGKMQNITKDIEENEKSLSKYKENQNNMTSKGTEISDAIEKFQREVLPKFKEQKTTLKNEVEVINEKEHQLKRDDIEQKNTLKNYDAKESETKAILKSILAKIAKLKLNEIEGESTEIPTPGDEELSELDLQNLMSQLDLMQVSLNEKTVDFSAVEEYKKKMVVFKERDQAVKAAKADKRLQGMRFSYLTKRRLDEFLAGFAIIAKKLKEIYQMLTLGGDAEVEIKDHTDLFGKGIELVVRPPRKAWKLMRNLSGGEKTLSSLALVFAIHHYRPTPFYVMDEIDAALDVRNVGIVGFLLKERTKNAQFIIVSLRNVMNELSDHLLGIYKINNCTRNIVLNCKNWEAFAERQRKIQEREWERARMNGRGSSSSS